MLVFRRITIYLFLAVALFTCPVNATRVEQLSPDQVLPELNRFGLPDLKVQKHFHSRLENLFDKEDRYFLVIHLGQLTLEQFNEVNALYGNHSRINYDPGREYRLKDFLPPSVQAVLNRTFTPIQYDLSFLQSPWYAGKIEKLVNKIPTGKDALLVKGLMDNGLGTETNCWNTTIETLNAIHSGTSRYRLFTPARWEIDSELKNENYGRAIPALEELKPWDVLLISKKSPYTGQEILQHTALVINENLVFEKVDAGADYPYRLSLFDDVFSKYRRALAETFRSEYRRYKSWHIFYKNAGVRKEPYPDLTAKIIGKVRPKISPEKLSYGCGSDAEDNCTYSFQVIETLKVGNDEGIGKFRGQGGVKNRLQLLEKN